MKLIAARDSYQLFYDPSTVNRYKLYQQQSTFKQMICQAQNFTQKIKSYFTKSQVDSAVAKVHGFNYANRKFKS